MGVSGDWLEQGLLVCGARFVLLTCCTASYVLFCEFFHFFPLVSLAEEVYGVCDTRVSREGMIVVCL
jgi:hypothetical protein